MRTFDLRNDGGWLPLSREASYRTAEIKESNLKQSEEIEIREDLVIIRVAFSNFLMLEIKLFFEKPIKCIQ